MYAVVSVAGHQYIVKKGDTLVVDHVDNDFSSSDVLCIFDEDGKNVIVGSPFVSGVSVSFAVQSTQKGKKVRVLKFKRKNRYMRTKSFRPLQTTLLVSDISVNV